MKPGRSIRGRLVLWIFLAGSGIVLLLDVILFHEVKDIAFQSIDNVLHSKLQLMKGLIHTHGEYVEVELAEVARGEYSIPNSGHYYQIFIEEEPYMISPSLPPQLFNLISDTPESYNKEKQEWLYQTTGPHGDPLLVLRNDFELQGKTVSVRIAETLTGILAMLSRLERFFFVHTRCYFFDRGCWLPDIITCSATINGFCRRT